MIVIFIFFVIVVVVVVVVVVVAVVSIVLLISVLMIRYERTNVTQNVTQLRERYKAIQEMIADAQRFPKRYS